MGRGRGGVGVNKRRRMQFGAFRSERKANETTGERVCNRQACLGRQAQITGDEVKRGKGNEVPKQASATNDFCWGKVKSKRRRALAAAGRRRAPKGAEPKWRERRWAGFDLWLRSLFQIHAEVKAHSSGVHTNLLQKRRGGVEGQQDLQQPSE